MCERGNGIRKRDNSEKTLQFDSVRGKRERKKERKKERERERERESEKNR